MTKLASIAQRLAHATPGPWAWSLCYEIGDELHWALVNPEKPDNGVGDGVQRILNADLVLLSESHNDLAGKRLDHSPDFEFIAHAPEDVAALVGAVREARELLNDVPTTSEFSEGWAEDWGKWGERVAAWLAQWSEGSET